MPQKKKTPHIILHTQPTLTRIFVDQDKSSGLKKGFADTGRVSTRIRTDSKEKEKEKLFLHVCFYFGSRGEDEKTTELYAEVHVESWFKSTVKGKERRLRQLYIQGGLLFESIAREEVWRATSRMSTQTQFFTQIVDFRSDESIKDFVDSNLKKHGDLL